MAQNHYELLCVQPTSTQAEIRSAYRKLVLKHHPDHSSDPGSPELLRRIVEAYDVLSDKAQRREYDDGLNLEIKRKQARANDDKARQAKAQPKPQPAAKPNATNELSRLASLFNKGRFDEAERVATMILSRNRSEPLPYVVLGDIARARGDVGEAINMYARAVQAGPRNPLYQKRYEELISASAKSETPGTVSSPAEWSTLFAGVTICVCACVYITLSKEKPVFSGLSLISTWTLGLMVMLFISGVTAGVSLSRGGLLDRFNSVSTTSLGKISPAMALGSIAVVCFWAAAAIYTLLGVSQKAFNVSTTRLLVAVAAIVGLSALSARYSSNLDGIQVLLWGGNLSYIGAMCGWMVSDSMK
jgi:tetratricopeptide (TPR) repeat protein